MGRNEKTLPSVNMWRVGGGKERCLHFPQMTAATKHQNVNGWSWRQCSYLACLKIFVYTRAGQHFNIRRHIGYISIILSSDWYVQKSDITQTEYISQNVENVRVLNFGSKKKLSPLPVFFPVYSGSGKRLPVSPSTCERWTGLLIIDKSLTS